MFHGAVECFLSIIGNLEIVIDFDSSECCCKTVKHWFNIDERCFERAWSNVENNKNNVLSTCYIGKGLLCKDGVIDSVNHLRTEVGDKLVFCANQVLV